MSSAITITALIVDDKPELIGVMRDRLTQEFANLDITVDWSATESPDEAIRWIRTGDFDLVVADIIFERIDDVAEPRTDIVAATRLQSATTFILSVTTQGIHNSVENLAKADRDGADLSLERNRFTSEAGHTSPAAVAERIRETLVLRGRIAAREVQVDPPDDLRGQAFLDQFGAPVISELYKQALRVSDWGKGPSIQLKYLNSGLSGSSVCALSASNSGQPFNHVLKLGRDRDLLKREVERGQLLKPHLSPRTFVGHSVTEPVGPIDGWYAITLPLLAGSDDFRSWLRSKRVDESNATIARLLEVLFVEELGPLYQATSNANPATNALADLTQASFRSSRIKAALARIAPAIERAGVFDGSIERLVEDVNLFAEFGQLAGRPPGSFDPPNWRCMNHGDLHGGNILIYQGAAPSPAIIDSSEVAESHWAGDAARLHVDFVLEGVAATTDSYFWEELTRWRESAKSASIATHADVSINTAALVAATWLSTELDRWALPATEGAPPSSYRWAWHAALAAQYSRAIYRPTLPPPVVALAALAAWDQLRLSATAAPLSAE
ncbi:MAG: hypothetical protein JWR83_1696 [Aeromicrobium sp.]|nr:hypothetical protein [Aeromicrobium sp.]